MLKYYLNHLCILNKFSLYIIIDRARRSQNEIEDVKNVMVGNIERVLQRGERIELLVDRTEGMKTNAFKFKKQSTQLKRAMWYKNVRLMIIIGFVIVVVIYFVVAMICGGFAFQGCVKK